MSMYIDAKHMFISGDEISICYGSDDNGNLYVDVKIKDVKELLESPEKVIPSFEE